MDNNGTQHTPQHAPQPPVPLVRNGRVISTDDDYDAACPYLLAQGWSTVGEHGAMLAAAWHAGTLLAEDARLLLRTDRDTPDNAPDNAPDNTPASTEAEAQLAEAERRLAQAEERGNYHRWSNRRWQAYTEAQRQVRQARKQLHTAQRAHGDDTGEGRGAFAFALIAFMLCGATLAAWALYLTTRGF